MNSEEILKTIKWYLESEPEFSQNEIIITPTKFDPTKPQHKVSFIVMERVSGGSIPRFEITVNDLQNRNT